MWGVCYSNVLMNMSSMSNRSVADLLLHRMQRLCGPWRDPLPDICWPVTLTLLLLSVCFRLGFPLFFSCRFVASGNKLRCYTTWSSESHILTEFSSSPNEAEHSVRTNIWEWNLLSKTLPFQIHNTIHYYTIINPHLHFPPKFF